METLSLGKTVKGRSSHHGCQKFTNPLSRGDGHPKDHLHGEVGEGASDQGFKGQLSEGREDKVEIPERGGFLD